MIDIGGNDHPSARYFIAHELRRNLLPLGHIVHFFCNEALPGIVHLGEIAAVVFRFAAADPLRTQARDTRRAEAVSALSIGGWHRLRSLTIKIRRPIIPRISRGV